MGGDIVVRSTPGVGSLFTVHLPFAPVPAHQATTSSGHRSPGAVRRALRSRRRSIAARTAKIVLVAEDNEINQQVVMLQLDQLGYRCEIADNGRDALALWRTGRFDLLFTDLQMPVMDGYELAASIRAEETGGARLPIVALTANALEEEALRCKAAGMDDCLTKPVQIGTLGAALDKWLTQDAGIANTTPEQAPA